MKTSHAHALRPVPTYTEAASLPPAVRARLWLPGRVFWPNDDHARLWLALADGRVLAFRLPKARLGDDALIAPLAEAVAHDVRGMRWEVDHPVFGWAQVLYAAPVLPLADKTHAAFLFHAGFQCFVACLDAEVMRLLVSLEREPHATAVTRRDDEPPHPLSRRFFASVRNYNRLVCLPPESRLRRMQALARFPLLVAPILLTAHRMPNVWDGRRHAWRQKDVAVEAAIDAGRDLTGALAKHYGISRSLVRAELCAAMWPLGDEADRRGWLAMLDTLPANQRPGLAEFERWQPYFANYFSLLGETDQGHPLPQPPAVHRGAFRLGWTRTWETLARRYGDIHPALADCRDFLVAARAAVGRGLNRRNGPPVERMAAAWLACHGLLGLVAASHRWHRLRPESGRWSLPEGFALPAILGVWQQHDHRAEELLTPVALAAEGEAMHHCVADYWPECVDGDRIFALQLADGDRATAQYHPRLRGEVEYDTIYHLVQLRGPCNRRVSEAMTAWAQIVASELNSPVRQAARRAALEARDQLDVAQLTAERRAQAWLDARSERQLDAVLNWLKLAPLGPDVLLHAHIAGFQYNAGPQVEDHLAPGQPLELVREADNPHDPLAVRIDWCKQKLGYLPRNANTEIAARLDAGEALSARITDIDREAEPWRRVGFVVENKAVDV